MPTGNVIRSRAHQAADHSGCDDRIECLAARAAIESSVAALLRIVRSEIQTAIAPVSSFVEF